MGNRIFKVLLEEKIEIFKSSFMSFSKRIFFDETNNKLIHPGEYGMYREVLCKEFIRFIIPKRLDIEQGFLISPNEDISHQCDIIVFDKQNTPLIEDSERQRFFPIETVCAIGEVKSILSKTDLIKAINKLSNVKTIRAKLKNPNILFKEGTDDFNPEMNMGDQIVTFLICQKFDFDITNIENDMNNFYENENIKFKHNFILSIDDGLLIYRIDNVILPYSQKENLQNKTVIVKSDKENNHIKIFASNLFLTTSSTTLLFPHIGSYLQ